MASAVDTATFSNEEYNFFRLSCLLINEGTAAVCKLFMNLVSDTKKRLEDLLKERFTDMECYRKTRMSKTKSKKPRLFYDEQWEILYDVSSKPMKCAQSSRKFDLTLLSLLFGTLLKDSGPPSTKNWIEEPYETDESWQADVVRLRYTRNKLYGHIPQIGITDERYEAEFSALRAILLRLKVDNSQIQKWNKCKPPSSDEIKEQSDIILKLFNSDPYDLQAYGENLVHLIQQTLDKQGKSADESFGVVIKGINRLLENESRSQSQNNELSNDLRKVCEIVKEASGPTETLLHEILAHLHSKKQTDEILAKSVERLEQKLTALARANAQQASQIDRAHQELRSVSLLRHEAKLSSFKYNFQNKDNKAFRVLLITPPSASLSTEDFVELGSSLGRCPWEVVIDLDPESKKQGRLFDVLTQALDNHKKPNTKTFKELKSTDLGDTEKGAIANGQRVLYLMTLGCAAKEDINKDPHYREPISNTISILHELFDRARGNRQLVCLFLISSASTNACIASLIFQLEFICSSVKKESYYVGVSMSGADSFPDLNFLHEYPECKLYSMECTPNQVSSFFTNTFGNEPETAYQVAGDSTFPMHDLTFMDPYLELYHSSIGDVAFKTLNAEQIRRKRKEIQEKYLHGTPLTPEALYANRNGKIPVFVVRTEMTIILSKVKDQINQTKATTATSTIFEISHDPSGGGTTCGRYLLYSLKEEYPCLEVKKIDENLYRCLSDIRSKCNKICVILVDMPDIFRNDVDDLQKRLTHSSIQHVIIYVKLADPYDVKQETHHYRQYLQSKVTNQEDLASFQTLYKEKSKETILNQTVFLFGLVAYCGDYERLETHISALCDKYMPTSLPMRALRLCCIMSRYSPGNNHICTGLFLRLFGLNDDDDELLIERLGMARDFLAVTIDHVRLAISQKPVVELILKKLRPEDDYDAFKLIVNDIMTVIQKDNSSKEMSAMLVIRLIDVKEGRDAKTPCPFIADLRKACSDASIETLLQNLLQQICCDPYHQRIRCVYAKHLCYTLRRFSDSFRQMKLALKLEERETIYDVRTTDSMLLSVYGNLCREQVKYIASMFSKRDELDSSQTMLSTASLLANEAIFVYQRAQKSTDSIYYTNPGKKHHHLPFWAEASVRCTYVRLVLTHKFEKNLVHFHKYISSAACTDDLLKDFVAATNQPLEQYAYLDRNDKIYHRDSADRAQTCITRETFELLSLQVDGIHERSSYREKQRFIEATDVVFDVADIVRSTTRGGKRTMQEWKHLDVDELKFIFEQIKRRMHQPFASNYKNIILTMIYIRLKGDDEQDIKYNVKFAQHCADLWIEMFPDDIEGHFMRGVLYVVSGLQSGDYQTIEDGRNSIMKCYKLCEKVQSVSGYRRYRYVLGNGVGLAAAIPIDKKADIEEIIKTDPESIRRFTGRQIDNGKRVKIRVGDVPDLCLLTANISSRKDIGLVDPKEECLLEFNIVLAKSGLIAVNVERHRI